MQKRAIIVIIAVSLFTFGNSLFNGFVGDDEVLIVDNDFYKSWANVGLLFHKDFLIKDVDAYIGNSESYGSGAISYRPAGVAMFFVDYAVWKLNPFGYHLTNFLIHLANALLVYFIARMTVKHEWTALLGALLFCVHPLKSEAVCAISYRSDLFSCLFVLSAFLNFLRYVSSGDKPRSRFLIYSLSFYFLSLFAKESAIVFLFLIVGYEFFVGNFGFWGALKRLVTRYWSYLTVTVFYLIIYLFVFPNSNVGRLQLLGGNIFSHIAMIFRMFFEYLTFFVVPFRVQILPPLYSLPETFWGGILAWLGLGSFLLLLFMIIRLRRRSPAGVFFLFWFLVAFIPVSNLIPLANPMAHRFMYLPSAGFLIAAAMVIEKICGFAALATSLPNLRIILRWAFVLSCAVITIPLNGLWKNNMTVGLALTENYPDNLKGFSILGIEYFRLKRYEEAREALDRCLTLGSQDPRIHYMLGVSYVDQFTSAKNHFEEALRMFPSYAAPYASLGKLYYERRDYRKALSYFEKGLELKPDYVNYQHLLKTYIKLDQQNRITELLERAEQELSVKQFLGLMKLTLL